MRAYLLPKPYGLALAIITREYCYLLRNALGTLLIRIVVSEFQNIPVNNIIEVLLFGNFCHGRQVGFESKSSQERDVGRHRPICHINENLPV